MGLAALGSEKYIGQRPGHKQVLSQATPSTRGVQIMTLAQFQLQNLYCYVSRHHTPRKSTIGILDLFLHKSIYKIKTRPTVQQCQALRYHCGKWLVISGKWLVISGKWLVISGKW